MQTLALNAIILDDDARAANDLPRVAFLIDLAKTRPGAEDLGVSDLDEVDLVLGAESFDELQILGLGDGLDEDAKMGLALVKGLGTLAKAASETIMQKSVLQNLLECSNSESALRSTKKPKYRPTCKASSTDIFPPLGASAETSTGAASST